MCVLCSIVTLDRVYLQMILEMGFVCIVRDIVNCHTKRQSPERRQMTASIGMHEGHSL